MPTDFFSRVVPPSLKQRVEGVERVETPRRHTIDNGTPNSMPPTLSARAGGSALRRNDYARDRLIDTIDTIDTEKLLPPAHAARKNEWHFVNPPVLQEKTPT